MQPGSYAQFRLPPGRHHFSREEVARNQRWRLLGAAAEVVTERGYLNTKASDVSRSAGVSRTTFYKYFDDLPECLLAAHEMAADAVFELASAACDSEGEWGVCLREAVDAVLDFFTAEPALACLFGSEVAAGVAEVAIARIKLVERLVPLFAGGRVGDEGAAPSPPAGMERHLIAGAFAVVSDRIAAGEVESLAALGPGLVALLAAPYRVTVAG